VDTPSSLSSGKPGPSGKKPLKIGEILKNEGLITEGQLQEALAQQRKVGGKLVGHLIALNYLDQKNFVSFLAKNSGTASINLLNYAIPAEVIKLIPAQFALEHELLPIDKMGSNLIIAMVCPLDASTIEELVRITGLRVKPILVSMNDLHAALKRYYHSSEMTWDGARNAMGAAGVSAPPPQAAMPPQAPAPAAAMPSFAPGAETVPAEIPKIDTALHFERIINLARQVKALPALPETVRQVQEAVANPDISVAKVAAILQKDPALTAKILGLANSPAYGFIQRVQTIELATSMLGLREVYSLVVSSAAINFFEKSKNFDYQSFSKRSVFCATMALAITKASGQQGGETVFAAGLLHNIGKAVLAEVVPQLYRELDQNVPDEDLIPVEESLFGMAHPEVGFLLAEEWTLPSEIAEAIRFHHHIDFARDHKELVAAVALAAHLTDAYWQAQDGEVEAWIETGMAFAQALNLSKEQVTAIYSATSTKAFSDSQ
jgi:HD-like signal output (HDOD) protein